MGVNQRISKNADLFVRVASDFGPDITPSLLAALAWQESSIDPWAIRVERGFWSRYREGIMRFIKRSKSKVDNKWAKYPDIYSASYGMCQIMLQTALEAGWEMKRFPTELLDPEVNLRLAARILQKHIRRYGLKDGLLRYNGGARPAYADEVLGKMERVKELRLWAD